jgi:hypothetical protein
MAPSFLDGNVADQALRALRQMNANDRAAADAEIGAHIGAATGIGRNFGKAPGAYHPVDVLVDEGRHVRRAQRVYTRDVEAKKPMATRPRRPEVGFAPERREPPRETVAHPHTCKDRVYEIKRKSQACTGARGRPHGGSLVALMRCASQP